MGKDSAIEWTHHTFNPWRGCTKVSPGCEHCYAERGSKRNPKLLGVWGDEGTRVIAAETYWWQPLRWNELAKAAGERHRVFCASLADVFEDRPELYDPRYRLFELIEGTPDLDWLLLTKRPENIQRMIPSKWHEKPQPNIWLGTSVEDQQRADERIPHLLKCPAVVRFLSVEPLLGPIRFRRMIADETERDLLDGIDRTTTQHLAVPEVTIGVGIIHWVIVGGESGGNARPMHPNWVRSIRDECLAIGPAFFFKQWGEWLPYDMDAQPPFWSSAADGHVIDGHIFPDQLSDGDPVEGWLADMDPHASPAVWHRVGKKSAGRFLDGRQWNELPEVRRA